MIFVVVFVCALCRCINLFLCGILVCYVYLSILIACGMAMCFYFIVLRDAVLRPLLDFVTPVLHPLLDLLNLTHVVAPFIVFVEGGGEGDGDEEDPHDDGLFAHVVAPFIVFVEEGDEGDGDEEDLDDDGLSDVLPSDDEEGEEESLWTNHSEISRSTLRLCVSP